MGFALCRRQAIARARQGESGIHPCRLERLKGQVNAFERDNVSDKEQAQRPGARRVRPIGQFGGVEPDGRDQLALQAQPGKGPLHPGRGDHQQGARPGAPAQGVKGGRLEHVAEVAKSLAHERDRVAPGQQPQGNGFDAAHGPQMQGTPCPQIAAG